MRGLSAAVLIHRSELLGHPGLRAAALGPHGPRTALRRAKWKRRARIPRLVHIAGIVVGNDARQPCLSVCLSVECGEVRHLGVSTTAGCGIPPRNHGILSLFSVVLDCSPGARLRPLGHLSQGRRLRRLVRMSADAARGSLAGEGRGLKGAARGGSVAWISFPSFPSSFVWMEAQERGT